MDDSPRRRPKGALVPPTVEATPAMGGFTSLTHGLFTAVGLTARPWMGGAEKQALLKVLPGAVGSLARAATLMESDGVHLGRIRFSPAQLREMASQHAILTESEAALDATLRNVREQRMVVESQAMSALLSLTRRVRNAEYDAPGISERWGFLLDFMGAFFKGARTPKSKGSDKESTDEATTTPVASDKPAASDKDAAPASDKG